MDVQVSLDPELLGNVFENLLGAWNPETKETVRSNTGSFYTPREIVQYMVDKSLVSYLEENGITECSLVEQYFKNEDEQLFEKIDNEKKNEIIKTLLKVKILDPACGSGAFPVGCLTRMVELICALNPSTDTYNLKTKIIANNLYGIDIQTFAVQITKLRFFISLICEQEKTDDKNNNYGIKPLPNLETKFIAANTLVGLYKEKQITFDTECQKKFDELLELRQKHFSTCKRLEKKKLIVEYESATDDLINLLKKEFNLPTSEEISQLKDNIIKLEEDYNNCKETKVITTDLWGNTQTKSVKTETAEKIEIELKKAKAIFSVVTDPNKQSATLKDINAIAHWTPFDLNASSKFFDPFWMFGIKDKNDFFDIVIGNPPYIEEGKYKKAFDGFREQSNGIYYIGKMNLWYAFACFGIDWLKENGILSFIAKNNWGTNDGAKLLRNKIAKDTQILKMIDFGSYMVFESADIQTMIMMFKKNNVIDNYTFDCRRLNKLKATKQDAIAFLKDKTEDDATYIEPTFSRAKYENKLFTFTVGKKEQLLEKISNGADYLQKIEISQGITPNPDVVNKKNIQLIQKNKIKQYNINIGDRVFIIEKDKYSNLNEKEKKYIKPVYEPTDVDRYYLGQYKNEIIYITRDNYHDDAPNLIKHLEKYREIMDQRRENKKGTRQFYELHWPKDPSFFNSGEKILSVRKCPEYPTFVYTTKEAYVQLSFNVIITKRFNMKYLTGVLNSNLIKFWLKNKGKNQGEHFQIDLEPLLEIPIKKGTQNQQDNIIKLVDKIIAAKAKEIDTSNDENNIDKIVYEIYGITDQSAIDMIEGK